MTNKTDSKTKKTRKSATDIFDLIEAYQQLKGAGLASGHDEKLDALKAMQLRMATEVAEFMNLPLEEIRMAALRTPA